jgi:glycosyltransferase involved in cell wall biosynthesis
VKTGIVAIGRNEGDRLRACLLSARRDCSLVVYVDSGSTDGSVELARSLGVRVVELDLSTRFTAARARNEGFHHLLEIDPSIQAVQFVDGDCEIVGGWIAAASVEMEANPRAAVVCGRRRERFPSQSIYNRLCDMEWNSPTGQVAACGGDALIRASAFLEVGGYNPEVIAGEEPEMCLRLRARGWTIHRIASEMTLHDAAMNRFWQWWKRNVRSGHAYAQGQAMHGSPPDNYRRQEVRSIEFWAVWPVLIAGILFILLVIVRPRWSWLGITPLFLYPILALKIARHRLRRGDRMGDALLYGVALVAGKFPQHKGLRIFRRALLSGQASAIIEYKAPISRSKQLAVQGGHDVS